MDGFSPRRVALGVAALLLLVTGGAIGYHNSLDETWVQSFYRAVVTVSLAGLDTVPRNDESRIISIVLVIATIGLAIYLSANEEHEEGGEEAAALSGI